jgi:hypothetical protein
MLAVVVSDVEIEEEYQFERRLFGSSPEQLRSLAAWLLEQEVEEVVMESTAQYWKPVWETLERYWKPLRQKREGAGRMSGTLHLAQAQSNRGPRGRKKDFPDAERLVKRLVARELTLSCVPDAEQRLWRTVMRRKYQLRRNRVQLHNQLESQSNYRSHCPSTVSADLVDPAPGSPLRRTRPCGRQTIEATPHLEDASGSPKTRLPHRIAKSSTQSQPSICAVIFRPHKLGKLWPKTVALANEFHAKLHHVSSQKCNATRLVPTNGRIGSK